MRRASPFLLGIMPALSQWNERRNQCILIDGSLVPHPAVQACLACATRVIRAESSEGQKCHDEGAD